MTVLVEGRDKSRSHGCVQPWFCVASASRSHGEDRADAVVGACA